jgi:HNH endonuclease
MSPADDEEHRRLFTVQIKIDDTVNAEIVRELLSYDSLTGILSWKKRRKSCKPGAKAGSHHIQGYERISINYKRFLVHRICWLHFYGTWPTAEIDHINRNKKDNRIINLREATRSENDQNKVAQKNSKSGIRGVNWDKSRQLWEARITLNGKTVFRGRFDRIDDAVNAITEARRKFHPYSPDNAVPPGLARAVFGAGFLEGAK